MHERQEQMPTWYAFQKIECVWRDKTTAQFDVRPVLHRNRYGGCMKRHEDTPNNVNGKGEMPTIHEAGRSKTSSYFNNNCGFCRFLVKFYHIYECIYMSVCVCIYISFLKKLSTEKINILTITTNVACFRQNSIFIQRTGSQRSCISYNS